jgi:hypothetical protein
LEKTDVRNQSKFVSLERFGSSTGNWRRDSEYCVVDTAAAGFGLETGHPDICVSGKHRCVVEFLMAIVKSWGSEIGIEVARLGIQIHGGIVFIEQTGAAERLCSEGVLWVRFGCGISKTSTKKWIGADAV